MIPVERPPHLESQPVIMPIYRRAGVSRAAGTPPEFKRFDHGGPDPPLDAPAESTLWIRHLRAKSLL